VERVADKIGRIIRRATLVVAGLRCQEAQRHEPPILPLPGWDGALRAVCLVRLLAKERPRASPEEPRKAGVGQRWGCQDRAKMLLARLHPAAGSHLPTEDTASPSAVVPFASSPFPHPIPQSRRRAREDLFRASLSFTRPGTSRHVSWERCSGRPKGVRWSYGTPDELVLFEIRQPTTGAVTSD
jgi:hypothetical protein